jgi:hypothetical protein
MSCTSKFNINRILKVEKKAIRRINKSNYNEHTAQLFRNPITSLPFDKIMEQAKLTFMRSIEINYAPRAANTGLKTASIMWVMNCVTITTIFYLSLALKCSKNPNLLITSSLERCW